jgi:RimJ/RimL family protein N-acetyltransferase
MIYQNEDVRIVPFERKHLSERYRGWFHDNAVTAHNSHGLFPYSPAAMEAFVKTIEQGDASKIVWAIEIINPVWVHRKDGEAWPKDKWIHVGNCSLQSINFINRSAELAIVIGESEARGKGIGKQACTWLIEHGLLRIGLNRIWTGTTASNVAMQKTCLACGMEPEGVFHEGQWLRGQFVDVFAYGITRTQYNKGRITE